MMTRFALILGIGIGVVGLGAFGWWLQAGIPSVTATAEALLMSPVGAHDFFGDSPDGHHLQAVTGDHGVGAEAIEGLQPGSAALRFERPEDDCRGALFTGVLVQRVGPSDSRPAGLIYEFPSVLTDLEPGDYALSVKSPSWAVSPARVTLSDYDTATITLTSVSRLSGIVIDLSTGLRVEGASVRLLGSTSHSSAEAPMNSMVTMGPSAVVGGAFCLAGFQVWGDTRVMVTAKNHLVAMSEWLSSSAGVEWTGLVIGLSRPVEVSGYVLDADSGEPLQGVQLRLDLRAPDSDPARDDDDESLLLAHEWEALPYETLSMVDGAFAVRNGAGQLHLSAELEGYLPASLPMVAMEPGPLPEIVLRLERAPALWVQVVVDDPGAAAGLLHLKRMGVADPGVRTVDLAGRTLPSEVPFVGLPTGRYEVRLFGVRTQLGTPSPDGASADPLVLLATEDVDVVAGESQFVQVAVEGGSLRAGISGLLIPAPEIPLKDVVISAQQTGRRLPVGMSRVEPEGVFVLADLPDGELCVMATGASEDGSRVGVAIRCLRVTADTMTYDVVLDMLASRLRLARPDGDVLNVRITGAHTGDIRMDAALSSSGPLAGDADGLSELYGLPDGDYKLKSADGAQFWEFTIGGDSGRYVELFLADDA
jgi:hypothetical protein